MKNAGVCDEAIDGVNSVEMDESEQRLEPGRRHERRCSFCEEAVARAESRSRDPFGRKEIASDYVEIEVPSAVDSTLADDGSWIVTMFTQYGPWRADDWPDGAREAYGDRCLQIAERVAPGLRDSVIHLEVLAPPDLERIFGLEGGSIFQGEQGLEQMAFMRPAPLLAGYATPVQGLCLCGAGTHPGGGVTAACGHNAAQRILRDRRGGGLRRVRRALAVGRP